MSEGGVLAVDRCVHPFTPFISHFRPSRLAPTCHAEVCSKAPGWFIPTRQVGWDSPLGGLVWWPGQVRFLVRALEQHKQAWLWAFLGGSLKCNAGDIGDSAGIVAQLFRAKCQFFPAPMFPVCPLCPI